LPDFVIRTFDRIVGFGQRQIEKGQPPLGCRQHPNLTESHSQATDFAYPESLLC
jgi:hypothetical protein